MRAAFGTNATDRRNTGRNRLQILRNAQVYHNIVSSGRAIEQHKHELMWLSQFRNRCPCCNLPPRRTPHFLLRSYENTHARTITHPDYPCMADH